MGVRKAHRTRKHNNNNNKGRKERGSNRVVSQQQREGEEGWEGTITRKGRKEQVHAQNGVHALGMTRAIHSASHNLPQKMHWETPVRSSRATAIRATVCWVALWRMQQQSLLPLRGCWCWCWLGGHLQRCQPAS